MKTQLKAQNTAPGAGVIKIMVIYLALAGGSKLRILFLGDIVGKPGRKIIAEKLDGLKKEYKTDIVVGNGENAAGGFGLTEKIYQELRELGIEVITSGNHIWDKKEIYQIIDQEDRLLRPLNYSPKAPGRGFGIFNVKGRGNIGVINLTGRVFMGPADCPFRVFDDVIERIRKITPVILVDFHAEATSEKKAFLHYVDGRVAAVLGTHTHISTADSQITSAGTAYITDVGMTGVQDSVLGVEPRTIISRFLTGLPQRFEVARGTGEIRGVFLEVNGEGQTEKMKVITTK